MCGNNQFEELLAVVDTPNLDAEDQPDRPMATSELIGVVSDVASAFLANPSNRVDIG